MILLDTCALIFDALTSERLSKTAREAVNGGEARGSLACADISQWEIAMLMSKNRLDPGTDNAHDAVLVTVGRRLRNSSAVKTLW